MHRHHLRGAAAHSRRKHTSGLSRDTTTPPPLALAPLGDNARQRPDAHQRSVVSSAQRGALPSKPLSPTSLTSSSTSGDGAVASHPLDDDDWVNTNDDGVLFTILDDRGHRQQDNHVAGYAGGCRDDGADDGSDVGGTVAPAFPSKQRCGFDSISEASTISLDQQVTAFHVESEVQLAAMLQRLRDRTMSLDAMHEADEILRSSSPIEWNPYRPPRGERFRARLEAMQVLEWRPFVEAGLAIVGVQSLSTTAPTSGAAHRCPQGVVWTGPTGTAAGAMQPSNVSSSTMEALEVAGSAVVFAVSPTRHEDCAFGGVTEEVIEYHADDTIIDGSEAVDGEVLYVGVEDDADNVMSNLLDERRVQCGLPSLLPDAPPHVDLHEAEVIHWWRTIAEPMLSDAGLLEAYNNGCHPGATREVGPTTTTWSSRAPRGDCDVLTFGDSDTECEDESDDGGTTMRHESARMPTGHDSGTSWHFEQKTPEKGTLATRHLRRPSAPASMTQSVTEEQRSRGAPRVFVAPEPITTEVSGVELHEVTTTRSSRASVRKGLPGRSQNAVGRKASSLSPPPRRTRSSEVKAPSFHFGDDHHHVGAPRGDVASMAPLASMLVVRGDTVRAGGSAGAVHVSSQQDVGGRPLRAGRLSPIVSHDEGVHVNVNSAGQGAGRGVVPPTQPPPPAVGIGRQRAESTRRMPTREQQHAALLALEDDVANHLGLASMLAANSIAGAFGSNGGGLPHDGQGHVMPMGGDVTSSGGGGGFQVVGRMCPLNDRLSDHPQAVVDDVTATTPASSQGHVVRLPEIHPGASSHHATNVNTPNSGPSLLIHHQHRRFGGGSAGTTVPHRAHTAYVRPSAKKPVL